MKKTIDLGKFGHAPAYYKKELILEKEVDSAGIYQANAELGIRIGYDPDTEAIKFIDFDGGPMLNIGTKLDDYVVRGFSDYIDWPLRIILSKDELSR